MSTNAKNAKKNNNAVNANAANAVNANAANAANAASRPAPNDSTVSGTRNYISEAIAKEVLIKMQQDYELAEYPHAKVVHATLETFINLIVQKTSRNVNTTITNFATFSRRLVEPRMHKNPQTGKPVPKDAHYKMHVEIKPALKEKLEEIPLTPEDKARVKPL